MQNSRFEEAEFAIPSMSTITVHNYITQKETQNTTEDLLTRHRTFKVTHRHRARLYLLVSRGTCRRALWEPPGPEDPEVAGRHVPLVPVGAFHLGDGDFAAIIALAPFGRLFHFLGLLLGDGVVGMDVDVSHFGTRLFKTPHRD